MKFKRRKKSRRLRGSHTHGRGFKKKARGSGHRGGFGMAGTGKRGDAKKTLVLNLFGNDYFGKDRTLRRGHIPKKLKVINLADINQKLESFVKNGKAKEVSGSYTLDLTGYKILGEGELAKKVTITASAASTSAMKNVSKSSSSINLIAKSDSKSKKESKKEAKAEEKKPVKASK